LKETSARNPEKVAIPAEKTPILMRPNLRYSCVREFGLKLSSVIIAQDLPVEVRSKMFSNGRKETCESWQQRTKKRI
jgi:hypothetical protein